MISAAEGIEPARLPGFSTILGRKLLVFLLLIAFSAQGIAAQTHIHAADLIGLPAIEVRAAAPAQAWQDAGLPSDDDEAHCLLCQAVSLANGLSSPAAVGLSMTVQILLGVMAVLSAQSFLVRPIGHEGRQRAPPRA